MSFDDWQPVYAAFPKSTIAPGETATLHYSPQRIFAGPYKLIVPSSIAPFLLLRRFIIGCDSVLASFDPIDAACFTETSPLAPMEGPPCNIGCRVTLDFEVRGWHSIELVGIMLRGYQLVEGYHRNDRAHRVQRGQQRERWNDVLDILPAQRRLVRSDRVPVPDGAFGGEGARAPLNALAPEPPREQIRPNAVTDLLLEPRVIERTSDHATATPTRRELARQADEAARYLLDADDWSAWESPTDEG